MTNFKRGDIILVHFPFTDLSSTKQRPALVVSSDALNVASEDVLVAAISSQVPAKLASEEFMIPSGDLAACGLPKPSIVRLAKLAALHRQLVIKRIGSMPEPVLRRILAQIRQMF
ncbi:MAG: type II toxin-antitoxin system PemK/MazF family toxin [Verrucomicrobiota bacterium]|jgi:mRNA interferase MazF